MVMDYIGATQFITLAATTTAAGANITQTLGTTVNASPLYNARIVNVGTAAVAVTFGGGTGVVATATTGLIFGPNAPPETVNMGCAAKSVSVIALAGAGTVYVQV